MKNTTHMGLGRRVFAMLPVRLQPVHLTIFMIIVLGTVLALANSTFLSAYNINTILSFGAILMIVALGQMFVILIGGIDLSVGGVISFVSVLFVLLVGEVGYFAFPICLFAGVMFGLINGLILTIVKIPSFIATLGTGGIITSLAYLVSPRSISASPSDYGYFELIDGKILGMSNSFYIGVATFLTLGAFLRFSITGRNIYYIGSNIRMSWMSGTDIVRNRCIAFMISGGCAAIVGIIISSIRYGGDPVVGTPYVLNSIAAVVVGGTALTGGSGGIVNVLFGALFLSLLDNGLNVVGVDQYFQQALLGAMIVFGVAVTFDRSKTPIIK
ncbi:MULTISPECIES: ABC transporter permease [Pacificibacter]|uniref:ABC transporter permease n=1 Tax=Pacificibacter TaxID=1042323 RepID=UPI001C09B00B|nr:MULTISPECIES: ABC transporter permease [Pacificibacter]MBU2937173.1 ABC transporter permease [Pacificibacter marinus]MDO6617007.1 ABC transporter permease [Pacificibacter sp. 1_MG-2023]